MTADAPAGAGTVAVRAIELVPERLYSLGGMLALDGRIGWAPPVPGRWQPLNCYLLVEGVKVLMVDTGAAAIEAIVVDQLRSVLEPGRPISMFLSRAELDVIGNAVAVAQRYEITDVLAGGTPNPFDAMDQVTLSGRSAAPSINAIGNFDRSRRSIDLGNGRALELVRAPVRVLTCFWSYDTGTRTLFTADFFGGHTCPGPGYEPLAGAADPQIRPADVLPAIEARYWWLRGAHTRKLTAAIRDIFAAHDVGRIAPCHGCVVEGHDRVAEHVELVLAALDEIGAG